VRETKKIKKTRAVLFAQAWWHCHGADQGLAALPGHQRAQQPLAVDRIRRGAPVASGTAIFGFRPTPKFVPCREVEGEKLLGEFREVRIPTPRR
jgi:hypothetical protein